MLSKEELIRLVKHFELTSKYGLTWDVERTKEEFENEITKSVPVLEELTSLAVLENGNLPTNLLIEGDNYHTLTVLNYTHNERIDVIYIDPPYNTGNKTWKYNNRYVEKDDTFKHSKYLSFLNKRLKLARELLRKTGILICSIDDYEVHNVMPPVVKTPDRRN